MSTRIKIYEHVFCTFSQPGEKFQVPIVGNDTRWGSSYSELRYYRTNKKYLAAFAERPETKDACPPLLDSDEETIAALALEILAPFESVTVQLQAANSPAIAAIGILVFWVKIAQSFGKQHLRDLYYTLETMDDTFDQDPEVVAQGAVNALE